MSSNRTERFVMEVENVDQAEFWLDEWTRRFAETNDRAFFEWAEQMKSVRQRLKTSESLEGMR